MSPYLLYSDGAGNVFEDTTLYACGRSGHYIQPVQEEDWIELPGRRGVGIDVRTGELRECQLGWAMAAFIPPAHTGLLMAAYTSAEDAEVLPLFCYTAVGWNEADDS